MELKQGIVVVEEDNVQTEDEGRCENLKKVWEELALLDGEAIIIRRKGEPDDILRKWVNKNWAILNDYKRIAHGKDIAMAKVKLNDSRRWTYVVALRKEVIT